MPTTTVLYYTKAGSVGAMWHTGQTFAEVFALLDPFNKLLVLAR